MSVYFKVSDHFTTDNIAKINSHFKELEPLHIKRTRDLYDGQPCWKEAKYYGSSTMSGLLPELFLFRLLSEKSEDEVIDIWFTQARDNPFKGLDLPGKIEVKMSTRKDHYEQAHPNVHVDKLEQLKAANQIWWGRTFGITSDFNFDDPSTIVGKDLKKTYYMKQTTIEERSGCLFLDTLIVDDIREKLQDRPRYEGDLFGDTPVIYDYVCPTFHTRSFKFKGTKDQLASGKTAEGQDSWNFCKDPQDCLESARKLITGK